MRILHITSCIDAAAGGTTAAVAGLAMGQRQVGLDVAVLSTFVAGFNDSVAKSLESAGVKVTLVGPTRGKLQRYPDLAEKIDSAVALADVVHIAALWEEAQHLAAVSCRRRGVPYVISPHGMLDPWSLSQSKWKKRVYLAWRLRKNLDRAAAIHFTSDTERDLVSGMKLAAKSIIEPNGLNLTEFNPPPKRGAFRARFPLIGDRPMVLFMSRIHPKKGLDLLIPAFAKLLAWPGGKEAVLAIAGPDTDGYRAIVEKEIQVQGISNSVVWAGMMRGPERLEALVDADLFVLPSYQENFAIVVAESLAAGTPVVISDQVNIHREINLAGVGGVAKTDVASLSEKLIEWMTNPDRRQSAGRAIEFARERYDWLQIARRWGGHYHSLHS